MAKSFISFGEEEPDIFYYKDKELTILHREDGPAFEGEHGDVAYYIDGELHNENGPAVVNRDGTKKWYIKGKELTEGEFNVRSLTL